MTSQDMWASFPDYSENRPQGAPGQIDPWASFPDAPSQGGSGGKAAIAQDGSVGTDNIVRSLATGVPIIGGALNKADAAVNAALAPIVDPLLPDTFQKLSGDTFGQRYNQALAIQNSKDAAFEKQHPYINKTGNVVGAVGGTIPAIMLAPEMFGAGGGSLLARTLASGASGATIGGADAGVRSGGDLNQIKHGVEWGGLFGLAGPTVGKMLGEGANAVSRYFTLRNAAADANVTPQALSMLSRAATDDGFAAQALSDRLSQLGPEAILADLGPNLQKQAGALASMPGKAQQLIRSALADRAAGANNRIDQALNQNLGPKVIPSQIDAAIQDSQATVGQNYGPVMRNARAVDTENLANELSSLAVNTRGPEQAAILKVRSYLNIPGTDVLDPHPRALLATRQAIDGMLSTENNPSVVRHLTMARNTVDETLANAAPGIKAVDAQFSELARQREALARGQQVLDSGRTAPRPEEMASELTNGGLPQGAQVGPSAVPFRLSQGARAEIERIVGTNANDVSALNRLIKGEGDWNRQKLGMLFGQEKVDRLLRVLDAERVFADTNTTVTRNSETAARIAAQKELGEPIAQFGTREAFKAGGLMGAARSWAVDRAGSLADAMLRNPDKVEATRSALADALIRTQQTSLVDAIGRAQGVRTPPAMINRLVQAMMMSAPTTRPGVGIQPAY